MLTLLQQQPVGATKEALLLTSGTVMSRICANMSDELQILSNPQKEKFS